MGTHPEGVGRPVAHVATVLIVDDEPRIRAAVAQALAGGSLRLVEAATGRAAVALAQSEAPSVIVLDLALPDADGLAVCRALRQASGAGIIVLSARHAERDKVALLDAGADDYVTKPFNGAELRARVGAQLRRVTAAAELPSHAVLAGGLTIDLAGRTLARDGTTIHLTPTEWALLRTFVRHRGRTLTHRQLFREVWGGSDGDAQAYLRVHLANLRRKIEPDAIRPRLLITVPGVGYRFEADG